MVWFLFSLSPPPFLVCHIGLTHQIVCSLSLSLSLTHTDRDEAAPIATLSATQEAACSQNIPLEDEDDAEDEDEDGDGDNSSTNQPRDGTRLEQSDRHALALEYEKYFIALFLLLTAGQRRQIYSNMRVYAPPLSSLCALKIRV
jgi:hypothetical protein